MTAKMNVFSVFSEILSVTTQM